MTVHPARAEERGDQGNGGSATPPPVEMDVVLGAVREDIRQTLRTGWLDPGLEAAAGHPVFFTAAWSAIRPNVGRSFLALSRRLRSEAADVLRVAFEFPDLRKRLDADLPEEAMRRIEESARAAHLAAAKAQIVVHALYRAVRKDPISGTGREEPPIRRGIPEWQRWMSFQPAVQTVPPILVDVPSRMTVPSAPVSLRLLARWPSALSALWDELGPAARTDAWKAGAARLRRLVLAGMGTLPHPVELQWSALVARGFAEDERLELTAILAEHDAAMPIQTLTSAFSWLAFGAPEIGVEG
jgi:hypothetical protein